MFFLFYILLSFLFYSPSVRSLSPSRSLFSYPACFASLSFSCPFSPWTDPPSSAFFISWAVAPLLSLETAPSLSLNSSRDSSSLSFSNFVSHIVPTSYTLSHSLLFFLPTSFPISLFLSFVLKTPLDPSFLDFFLFFSITLLSPVFHLLRFLSISWFPISSPSNFSPPSSAIFFRSPIFIFLTISLHLSSVIFFLSLAIFLSSDRPSSP